MGKRSGELDPAVIEHIARETRSSPDEVEVAHNGQSRHEGLCGSSDLRDVLEREAAGNANARRAIDVYAHRIRKYVGPTR